MAEENLSSMNDQKFIVNIVQLPNKILREKSQDVVLPLSPEDVHLAETMIYHVEDSIKPNSKFRPAVGVAAIQYGIPKNMFYVYIEDGFGNVIFRDLLINPKVISKSNALIALKEGEGCLSVKESDPNQKGYVKRSLRIIVEGYSYFEKKVVRHDQSNYVAIVLQHELDHLEGKLFIDRIDHKNPWKKEKDLYTI